MTDGKTTDLSPAWSPDGAWLAYIGIAGNESEVYLMRADATRPPRPVTRGAVAHRVRWDSATGTMLVSGSWGAGSLELLRVEADGGPPSELNPPVSFGPMARFGDFDIGSHGELLVITREDSSGDVWIMEAQAGTY